MQVEEPSFEKEQCEEEEDREEGEEDGEDDEEGECTPVSPLDLSLPQRFFKDERYCCNSGPLDLSRRPPVGGSRAGAAPAVDYLHMRTNDDVTSVQLGSSSPGFAGTQSERVSDEANPGEQIEPSPVSPCVFGAHHQREIAGPCTSDAHGSKFKSSRSESVLRVSRCRGVKSVKDPVDEHSSPSLCPGKLSDAVRTESPNGHPARLTCGYCTHGPSSDELLPPAQAFGPCVTPSTCVQCPAMRPLLGASNFVPGAAVPARAGETGFVSGIATGAGTTVAGEHVRPGDVCNQQNATQRRGEGWERQLEMKQGRDGHQQRLLLQEHQLQTVEQQQEHYHHHHHHHHHHQQQQKSHEQHVGSFTSHTQGPPSTTLHYQQQQYLQLAQHKETLSPTPHSSTQQSKGESHQRGLNLPAAQQKPDDWCQGVNTPAHVTSGSSVDGSVSGSYVLNFHPKSSGVGHSVLASGEHGAESGKGSGKKRNVFGQFAGKLAAALDSLELKHGGRATVITNDDLHKLHVMQRRVATEDDLVSSLAEFVFAKVHSVVCPERCGGTVLRVREQGSSSERSSPGISQLSKHAREEHGQREVVGVTAAVPTGDQSLASARQVSLSKQGTRSAPRSAENPRGTRANGLPSSRGASATGVFPVLRQALETAVSPIRLPAWSNQRGFKLAEGSPATVSQAARLEGPSSTPSNNRPKRKKRRKSRGRKTPPALSAAPGKSSNLQMSIGKRAHACDVLNAQAPAKSRKVDYHPTTETISDAEDEWRCSPVEASGSSDQREAVRTGAASLRKNLSFPDAAFHHWTEMPRDGAGSSEEPAVPPPADLFTQRVKASSEKLSPTAHGPRADGAAEPSSISMLQSEAGGSITRFSQSKPDSLRVGFHHFDAATTSCTLQQLTRMTSPEEARAQGSSPATSTNAVTFAEQTQSMPDIWSAAAGRVNPVLDTVPVQDEDTTPPLMDIGGSEPPTALNTLSRIQTEPVVTVYEMGRSRSSWAKARRALPPTDRTNVTGESSVGDQRHGKQIDDASISDQRKTPEVSKAAVTTIVSSMMPRNSVQKSDLLSKVQQVSKGVYCPACLGTAPKGPDAVGTGAWGAHQDHRISAALETAVCSCVDTEAVSTSQGTKQTRPKTTAVRDYSPVRDRKAGKEQTLADCAAGLVTAEDKSAKLVTPDEPLEEMARGVVTDGVAAGNSDGEADIGHKAVPRESEVSDSETLLLPTKACAFHDTPPALGSLTRKSELADSNRTSSAATALGGDAAGRVCRAALRKDGSAAIVHSGSKGNLDTLSSDTLAFTDLKRPTSETSDSRLVAAQCAKADKGLEKGESLANHSRDKPHTGPQAETGKVSTGSESSHSGTEASDSRRRSFKYGDDKDRLDSALTLLQLAHTAQLLHHQEETYDRLEHPGGGSAIPAESPQIDEELPKVNPQSPQLDSKSPQLNPESVQTNPEPSQMNLELPLVTSESLHMDNESPQVDSESPQGNPESPHLDSKLPHTDPESSHVDSDLPHMAPESPLMDRKLPHVDPESPHADPGLPYVDPVLPHIDAESHVDPESRHMDPELPQINPESHVSPESPNLNPESLHMDPESSHLDPEAPHIDPESHVIRPESPELNPESLHLDPELSRIEQESSHLDSGFPGRDGLETKLSSKAQASEPQSSGEPADGGPCMDADMASSYRKQSTDKGESTPKDSRNSQAGGLNGPPRQVAPKTADVSTVAEVRKPLREDCQQASASSSSSSSSFSSSSSPSSSSSSSSSPSPSSSSSSSSSRMKHGCPPMDPECAEKEKRMATKLMFRTPAFETLIDVLKDPKRIQAPKANKTNPQLRAKVKVKLHKLDLPSLKKINPDIKIPNYVLRMLDGVRKKQKAGRKLRNIAKKRTEPRSGHTTKTSDRVEWKNRDIETSGEALMSLKKNSEWDDDATGESDAEEFACVLCSRRSSREDAMEAHAMRRHVALEPYGCPLCPLKGSVYERVERHILDVHKDVTSFVVIRPRMKHVQQQVAKTCFSRVGANRVQALRRLALHEQYLTRQARGLFRGASAGLGSGGAPRRNPQQLVADAQKASKGVRKQRRRRPGIQARCKTTKSPEEPYECVLCLFTAFYEATMMQHALQHVHLLPYACSLCKARYKTRHAARNHIKTTHQNDGHAHVVENTAQRERQEVLMRNIGVTTSLSESQRAAKQRSLSRVEEVSAEPEWTAADMLASDIPVSVAAHLPDRVKVEAQSPLGTDDATPDAAEMDRMQSGDFEDYVVSAADSTVDGKAPGDLDRNSWNFLHEMTVN